MLKLMDMKIFTSIRSNVCLSCPVDCCMQYFSLLHYGAYTLNLSYVANQKEDQNGFQDQLSLNVGQKY